MRAEREWLLTESRSLKNNRNTRLPIEKLKTRGESAVTATGQNFGRSGPTTNYVSTAQDQRKEAGKAGRQDAVYFDNGKAQGGEKGFGQATRKDCGTAQAEETLVE